MAAWRRTKRSGYGKAQQADWLVVGLGNPGTRYAATRHNAGVDAVAVLAERWHATSPVAQHDGWLAFATVADQRVALLVPLTYMNLSGQSVRPAMAAFGLEPHRLVVAHDEIDLPEGTVRVKVGGGLAGHNGLKSIAALVKSREFVRVRIGVGRPPAGDRRSVADWVLSRFDTVTDTASLHATAADAIERVVQEGPEAAMNAFNTR